MTASFNRTQASTNVPCAQRMRRGLYAVAAMLALCVAALAPSGIANAADLEQIEVSVPTTVPSCVMADGEVVGPTDWTIKNTGTAIARLSGITASDVYQGLQVSATVDGESAPFFTLANGQTGELAFNALDVQGGASVKVKWAFSKLDAAADSDLLSKAAQGETSVAKLALAFKCIQNQPVGFAVYSNYTDESGVEHNTLKFYKRTEVPAEGETFDGQPATKVYTGIEEDSYTAETLPWKDYASKIESAGVVDGSLAPASLANWFNGFSAMTSCDLSKLDASTVTSLYCTFNGCSKLASVAGIEGWTLPNVTTLYGAFQNSGVTSLDLSKWNTSKVTSLEYTFTACQRLEALNVSTWNVSSVANMHNTFAACSALQTLDIAGWSTSKVTNMQSMFRSCSSLASLDLSGFDTSNVDTMSTAFNSCVKLATVKLGAKWQWVDAALPTPSSDNIAGADGNWYDAETGDAYAPASIPIFKAATYVAVPPAKTAFAVYSAEDNSLNFYKRVKMPAAGETFNNKTATEVYTGIENTSYTSYSVRPWNSRATTITTVSFEDEGIAPTSLAYWFYNFSNMTTCNVKNLDTSNVTSLSNTFYRCLKLTSLNVDNWNTSKVTTMQKAFEECQTLATLDVSAWNTSSVTNTTRTFYNCKALTSISVDNWNVSNVTVMSSMFNGCTGLQSLDVSKWNTSSVTNLQQVFAYCSKLTALNVGSWDVSKVTTLNATFSGCSALATLDGISNWKTSNLQTVYSVFNTCRALTSLDLSGWTTSGVTTCENAFYLCSGLTSLNVANWDTSNFTSVSNAFRGCKLLATLDLTNWDTSKVTSASNTFTDCEKLASVTFGNKWKWYGIGGYLPEPSKSYITGADGSWYNAETADAYAPKEIPSNKAATYVAKSPKPVFAVYSDDDKSLSFYKRAEMPNVGDKFNGKAATEVYTGLEKTSYSYSGARPWSSHATTITDVSFEDEGIAPTSLAYWFYNFSSMTKCNVENLDTSKATGMSFMFNGCSKLASLDVSSFDTSGVTSMSFMFNGCSKLASLDVSSFDTSGVTSMYHMFYNCSSLTSLDLSGFDTSSVTDMSYMFYGCSSLTSLDLSKFDTSKATGMSNMFSDCSKLASLDVSSFDTSKVTSMSSMFYGCRSLTFLDPSKFDTSNVTNMSAMFYGCRSLTFLDPSKFDTSNVTNMSYMFYVCSSLTSLDPSKFDTSNVTNMSAMFYGCSKLASLDVSSFDTSSVTDMSYMFSGCSSLTSPDLSKFDTSKVTSMSSMFSGCSSLTSPDLSKFDTSNVTNMSIMFSGCSSLTSLDLSMFDTSNVTNMSTMFYGCSSLTSLDLSMFDTSNVTNMRSMFNNCSSLTSLDVSGLDTSGVTSMSSMFSGCFKLATVKLGAKWQWAGDGYLPTQTSDNITGADGNWYALSNSTSYVSEKVPGSKADTYYASKALRDAAASSSHALTEGAQVVALSAEDEGSAVDGAIDATNATLAAGQQATAPVAVPLKASGVDFAAATPVLVTLQGDSGCTYAVVDGAGRTVSLQPGRYRVSAVSPISANGQLCATIETFWVDVADGMKPISFNVSPAAGTVASDAAARVAEIEDWLRSAGDAVSASEGSAILSQARQAASQAEAQAASAQGEAVVETQETEQ